MTDPITGGYEARQGVVSSTTTSNAVALVERLLAGRVQDDRPRLPESLRSVSKTDRQAAALIQSQAARIAEPEGALDDIEKLFVQREACMLTAERQQAEQVRAIFARSLLSEEVRGDYGQEASVPSVQDDKPASHGEGGA